MIESLKKHNISIALSLMLIGVLIYLFIAVDKLKCENKKLHSQNKFIVKYLSGGIKNMPKANGELREKQLSLLRSLVEFDKFAKKHQVEYWLEFGTLLGAVRHQGFIPWDDDIDIAMTEENLAKLRKLSEDKSNNIGLAPARNDPRENLWFFSNQFGGFDIFVFAFIPKKEFNAQALYTYWINNLKFLGQSYIKEKIFDRFDSIKQAPPIDNAEEYFVMMRSTKKIGDTSPYNSHFSASDVFPLKKHNFEGYEFWVPKNFDAVLSTRYGKSYNELPDDFGYSPHIKNW